MQSLIEFFEKETNKKINMFKYNNEKITSNQNLIEFNNTTYVIEFLKDSILNHVNGHCYLFNQQNLDFDSLKNILNNLYEDVQIYNYNNYLLLVSDDILDIDGIDEIHIGLNDLHLGYKMKFMFELLADGTVEYLCNKFKQKNITYGFGGIAALGEGTLPAENIIKEHYRLGSSMVILSRSFCNTSQITDLNEIDVIFKEGVKAIRDFEKEVNDHLAYFEDNRQLVKQIVKQIVDGK